jgi:transposase-like protein
VTLRGKRYLLWRPVDQHGAELDILLLKRRDKAAAKRFFKLVLAACPEVPRMIVTDQLRTYPEAIARTNACRPASVNSTPDGERTRSGKPIASSRSAIRRLSAEGAMCSRFAALVIEPSLTVARNSSKLYGSILMVRRRNDFS